MQPNLPLLLSPTLVHCLLSMNPHSTKRQICIPSATSHLDPLADDAAVLNLALQTCGPRGIIHIPSNTTWTLHSSIDLSPCAACEFQIDGLINIDLSNTTYWETQAGIFNISNVTGAVITSSEESAGGTINAHNVGGNWTVDGSTPLRAPALFSISHASNNIYISNLLLRNLAGPAFELGSQSSGIHISSITTETTGATHSILIQNSTSHISIQNTTLRASNSCVEIQPDATNIEIQDSICHTPTNTSDTPSGIRLQYEYTPSNASDLIPKIQYIRHMFVRNVTFSGALYGLELSTAQTQQGTIAELFNATFADVRIEGPARRAVVFKEAGAVLNVTEVDLKGWKGREEEGTALVCQVSGDTCEIEVEDWGVERTEGSGTRGYDYSTGMRLYA